MTGEKIIYTTKLHWLPLYALSILLIPLWGLGLIVMLFRYLLGRTAEFGVTDKRVIMKTGILSKHTCELLLRKIESVNIEQGIFGSMFGYGAVTITGTGGTKEKFENIADPLKFRKVVNEQIELISSATAAN